MEPQATTQNLRSPVVDLIWSHSTLCEEVYNLLLDENRILRGSGELEGSGLLDKKRMLLNALDNSLQQMRQAARAATVVKTPALRSVATKAQRVLLKAMLLDKENEQLLLKHALSSSSGEVQIIPKPTAKQVKKRYENQN
jgi:hypothetical protein